MSKSQLQHIKYLADSAKAHRYLYTHGIDLKCVDSQKMALSCEPELLEAFEYVRFTTRKNITQAAA